MRSIRGEKQAYVALWKLITFVLLALILIMVIFGYRQGFFSQGQRIEEMYNTILIKLDLKEAPISTLDCKERTLDKIPGGTSFANKAKLADNERWFRLCGGSCAVGDFSRTEGIGWRIGEKNNPQSSVFSIWPRWLDASQTWQPYEYYLRGKNITESQNERDLYEALYQSLNETQKQTIIDFYHNRFTPRFIVYADGAGGNDGGGKSFLIWQNGIWTYSWAGTHDSAIYAYKNRNLGQYNLSYSFWAEYFAREDTLGEELFQKYASENIEALIYIGTDTKKALEALKKVVWGGTGTFDDDITYFPGPNYAPRYLPTETSDKAGDIKTQGASIKNYVGDCGGDKEMDCEDDYENFQKEFDTVTKQKLYDKTKVQPTELVRLKGLLIGHTFTYKGTTYTVGIDEQGMHKEQTIPIITFNSDTEQWGLAFSHTVDDYFTTPGPIKPVELNYLPIKLVKKQGTRWITEGEEPDFKLKQQDFELFKQGKIIRDFLFDTCRADSTIRPL